METLQATIFIEFDVNTKKITFLRKDNIIDYDSNGTSVYVRVKYKNLSGNTVYLTLSELEGYKFSLYTIKPVTNNINVITGEITDELKENVSGGVVKFEIPRTCTNRLGIVKCEIHIEQENKRIGSSTFILDVEQSLVTAFDDELLEDEDFPILKQLILEAQKTSSIDDNNKGATTTYSSNKIESIKEDLSSQISAIGGSGGNSGEGMTSAQAQRLNAAYEHSQSTHAPSNAEANVQVDWNETNTTSDAYIKNKPTNLATTDDIPTVPTNVSELTNDAHYASETFVTNKIAEASLGGGEVDLSGYVTKETGNANQITFADGQTFQEKYDHGMLTGAQGIQGIQGPAGKDAAIPNFTFAINMIASDQTAYVTTTGVYPNLVITFNIPRGIGESTGTDPEPVVEGHIYYGRISAEEAGIPPVIQFNQITAEMIKTAASMTIIEPQTLGKTSLGKESTTATGDYCIVAVPTSKGYSVTKDNGIGTKTVFNDQTAGANGEVTLDIDGIQYSIYGELLSAPAEIFIYID